MCFDTDVFKTRIYPWTSSAGYNNRLKSPLEIICLFSKANFSGIRFTHEETFYFSVFELETELSIWAFNIKKRPSSSFFTFKKFSF